MKATSPLLVMLVLLITEAYWRKRKSPLVVQLADTAAPGIVGGHDCEVSASYDAQFGSHPRQRHLRDIGPEC